MAEGVTWRKKESLGRGLKASRILDIATTCLVIDSVLFVMFKPAHFAPELWRDTHDPAKVLHSIFDILFFRILAIVAGYKDCNDLDTLRKDSIFKVALRLLPTSLKTLTCQATMSRMENSLKEKDFEGLLDYSVEIYCNHGYSRPPSKIILDIDETICKTYGDQQGS